MDIDLTAPEQMRDPYPGYERIRAEGKVVWNDKMKTWMVVSDHLCRKIFMNYSQANVGAVEVELFGEEAFISIDDKKRHDVLRNVWEIAFRRSTLEALRPRILSIIGDLLDPIEKRLRDGEAVEMISAFCRDLPVQVVSEMFGIPKEMRPTMVEWSDAMLDSLTAMGDTTAPNWIAGENARVAFAAYLLDEIKQRRAKPGDDLISRALSSDAGKQISDEDMMHNCRQLLYAGNESTSKWLSASIAIFGKYRDTLKAVSENHALILPAMEEVMRWDGISQIMPRLVRNGPIEVEGVTLQDGQDILLVLGAANRDPERYADPARFDIHRERKNHLGFGLGLHTCLGAPLARVEAEIAMSRFFDRIPDYELDREIEFMGYVGRGPTEVPIRLPN